MISACAMPQIDTFFKPLPRPPSPEPPPPPKRRPGRPPKPKPAETVEAPPEPLPVPKQPPVQKRKPVQKRTAWNDEEHIMELADAVQTWLDGAPQKRGLTLGDWAAECGIPKGTLAPYVTLNTAKRKKIGNTAGRPSLLDPKQQAFVSDVVRRCDRANEPRSVPQVVDLLQDLGGLDRKQARNCWDRTIHPKEQAAQRITGVVTAQATTTKRAAITVAQQFR